VDKKYPPRQVNGAVDEHVAALPVQGAQPFDEVVKNPAARQLLVQTTDELEQVTQTLFNK